jgi:hypothetical protein
MRFLRLAALVLILVATSLPIAEAQFDKDYKKWYPHIAAGWSSPIGDFDDLAKDGWEINGGVTYKPSEWPLGVILDLAYNDYNLERDFLDGAMASGGDATAWSLTGGGIWAPTSGGKVGFYLSGAVGAYRLKAQLTEPGTGCGICCDPFYPGWCWTCCGGVTVITGQETTTEFGGSLAAGLTFKVGAMGSTIFLECKYNYVNTDREPVQYVPVTVGYRW